MNAPTLPAAAPCDFCDGTHADAAGDPCPGCYGDFGDVTGGEWHADVDLGLTDSPAFHPDDFR